MENQGSRSDERLESCSILGVDQSFDQLKMQLMLFVQQHVSKTLLRLPS